MSNHELAFSSVELAIFDFDGVFTDNSVYVSETGVESVKCSRSDGIGLSRLSDIGVLTLILSTESNPVVSQRAKKLQLDCKQDIKDKKNEILALSRELSIDLKNILFLGNDVNDLEALKVVGLPVAVADAYEEILPHVHYRTKKNGGHGAVREVCDLIYSSKLRP